MNEALCLFALLIVSVIFYLPSLYARFLLSGKKLSSTVFWSLLAYNFSFAYIHLDFARNGKLPFFGYMDNSVMGWVSYFFIFAHAFSFPSPPDPKKWVHKKKTA
ncbi:hypothetical protein [Pseudomonas syringae group genomosp. 3]|uniref:hypothetical protein n=1 Tax=Pseudomonas syringae group genomosp. 3 TaxID=251701 RepID=UPI0011C3BD76|nr:hypothetical protein [Pseudomonas syringae group genomosp. 3]